MDAVPWKFVDSVVELFGMDTLNQMEREVRHPLWKDVVDLHHRNRVYYRVDFRKKEGGIKHVSDGKEVSMRTIRKKGRFARIVIVCDSTRDRYIFNWDEVETLGEADATKLLETVAPLIDPASGEFWSSWGSLDCTNWILTSLFKRVYLRRIIIPYCGQIAYDFLEDQINNSPCLSSVDISGENWPKSALDLMTDFCLKGRPGKLVYATFGRGIHLDSSYIQNLLDLWKENRNLNFQLLSTDYRVDKEGLQAVMEKGTLTWHCNNLYRFFKHESEKSVVILSNNSYLTMECHYCECDKSERCQLKNKYSKCHKF
uniref:F-box domain-containing protein n=1 Tax=Steinernema glaseri TaxID=37863 RepID=A0A1I8A2L1_9BILA